jgi:hypothetical protein
MKKVTIYLLLLLCGLSCEKSTTEENHQDENDDIRISIVETIDGTQRTLQLLCSTREEYPCANYGISTTYHQTAGKIDLSFGDIVKPGGCLTAIGPATSNVDLGVLANGTYELNINSSKGKLVVSDESYSITFSGKEKFEIVNPQLMRIPSNTIWGTIGYHDKATAVIVQAIVESLQGLGAVRQQYKQGFYGEFDIDSSGQIVQPGEDSGYYFAHSFIFHYSGDMVALEKVVKYYGSAYGETFLYLDIHTDKGITYRSWEH